jgi:hypothetical protein
MQSGDWNSPQTVWHALDCQWRKCHHRSALLETQRTLSGLLGTSLRPRCRMITIPQIRPAPTAQEVHPEAALHVGDRASKDRDGRAQLLQEHRCNLVGNGAALQKRTPSDEEGTSRSRKRTGAHCGIEDGERHWRYATDPGCHRGVPASNGRDGGKQLPVPQPEAGNAETVYDQISPHTNFGTRSLPG